MREPKLCPMTFGLEDDGTKGRFTCLQEKCEWWSANKVWGRVPGADEEQYYDHPTEGHCAILDIGRRP